ncbi:MAG: SpoIIE family protein phosphatase [Planctomycetes bacterium]|nr:SpoIIE family protein phosphatase [Planctomycetota bacterium]
MATPRDTERRTRVARSLVRARAVQLGMLPDAPKVPELDIGVHYEACEELGGDFYDFIQVSPTELGIVLADVSGHGLDAALMMAAAKKTLQIHGRRNPSPAEVLKIACEDLAGDLPTGSFVTVWYGVINLQTGLLRYASAGHNPLLRRTSTGGVSSHHAKGVVLGSAFVQAMQSVLEEQTLQLAAGDWVLLYTDGVSEAADPKDAMFGEKRLGESFAAGPNTDAIDLLQHLREDVETFRDGREPDDDVTLVAFRFRGGSEPALQPAWQQRIESNLPQRSDTFVGREAELKQISDALEGGAASISIIGVAGMGKTRLALELARLRARKFEGGAWFVPITECRGDEDVLNAVASVVGIPLTGDDPLAELGRGLAMRGPMLLVLDNAESAIEAVNEMLAALPPLAPQLACIVTSQLRLSIPDDLEIALKPLESPGAKSRDTSVEDAAEFPAVKLFVDRAKRSYAKFQLTVDNLSDVLGICAELEGVPLAIELAASRMSQLAPAEVFRQLKTPTSKIAVLRARTGDLGLPYQSMREALEWSYALLDDWEQYAFRQLCAFRGGFFIDAAEAIVKLDEGGQRRSAIEAIDSLLDKSFLWRDSTPYGTRFNTFSALREFATRLTTPEETKPLMQRHKEYFADYANHWTEAGRTTDVLESGDRLTLDRDNLRTALRTALDDDDARAGMPIFEALFSGRDKRSAADIRPLMAEVWDKFQNAGPMARVTLLQMRTQLLFSIGGHRDALPMMDEAVKIAEESGKFAALSSTLLLRGRTHSTLANDDLASADFLRLIEEATKAGEERSIGLAKISLGNLRARQSRGKESEKLHREAAAIMERVGDPNQMAVARINLIMGLLRHKRYDEAEREITDLRPFLDRLDGRDGIATIELATSRLLEGRGELEEALEHCLIAQELYKETGHSLNVAITHLDIASLSLNVGDLDAAREAVEFALNYARSSHTLLLQLRAANMASVVELECGAFDKAKALAAEILEANAGREDIAPSLQAKSILALAEYRSGNLEGANAVVLDAIPRVEASPDPPPGLLFLLTGLRARILQSQGKNANAQRFAAKAREMAEADGYTRYSTSWIERMGVDLIDVPATPEEAVRVRVWCPVCGQRYQGSEVRIRSLKKCMKCGMKPFKPLKVQDGD